MGKYMRKSKLTGELAVMEVSGQSSIGSAHSSVGSAHSSVGSAHSSVGVRTRARTLALQRLQKPTSSPATDNLSTPCYLQLRSRRLEKPSVAVRARPPPETSTEADGADVSFGENVLEAEASDREKTPCSLIIRSSEAARTPASATRPSAPTALTCRVRNTMHQNIPSAHEMEEFFAGSERLQQRAFIEKYNFDPLNDCPLTGRYEWVKLDSEKPEYLC